MKGIEKLLELVFSIIKIFRTISGSLFEQSLFKVIYYSFLKPKVCYILSEFLNYFASFVMEWRCS